MFFKNQFLNYHISQQNTYLMSYIWKVCWKCSKPQSIKLPGHYEQVKKRRRLNKILGAFSKLNLRIKICITYFLINQLKNDSSFMPLCVDKNTNLIPKLSHGIAIRVKNTNVIPKLKIEFSNTIKKSWTIWWMNGEIMLRIKN